MSFLTKRPSRGVTVAGAVVLAAGILIGYAGGGIAGSTLAADKAVASGSKLAVADGTTPLLTATVRSTNVTDLMLQISAECAIETSFTRDGKTTHQEAAGTVKIWVEIDGVIVPINGASAPPQKTPQIGNDSDKVTFCERQEGYEKTDGSTTCVEETIPPLTEGGDPTTVATGCETESWFQKVKTANAFNWIRLNVGQGTHNIVVKGQLTTTTSSTTPNEAQTARALVGNRTLIVEPTKMANDILV